MRLADLFRSPRAEAAGHPSADAPLVEQACRDADLAARLSAVDRLPSDDALKRVAIEGHYLDARLRAVGRIQDPRVLAAVMRERKNYQLMLACFARIRDEEVLAGIARDPAFNIAARRIAVQMFSEPALHGEVLNGIAGPDARDALGERAGVAADVPAPPPEEIEARVARLRATYADDVLVEALASFRDSPGAVRAMGVMLRLGSEASPRLLEVLARLLRHAGPRIRVLAVEALAPRAAAEHEALETAAESDPDPRVREAATRVLQGADTLGSGS